MWNKIFVYFVILYNLTRYVFSALSALTCQLLLSFISWEWQIDPKLIFSLLFFLGFFITTCSLVKCHAIGLTGNCTEGSLAGSNPDSLSVNQYPAFFFFF